MEALAQQVAERVVGLVATALDVNALVARVDVNALLGRIDMNALLQRVDLNALLSRVDLDEVLRHVDMDAIVDRVDVNEVAERIDMDELVEETDLGAVIARSSGGFATEALDAARSQAVGLDQSIDRWAGRLLRRRASRSRRAVRSFRLGGVMSARSRPAGWVSLQGQYAGTASRFLAYVIDLVVSTAVFTLAVAGVSFVIETVTRHSITWTTVSGGVTTAVFVAWEFFYFGYSWAASGKTFGMAVLGIRVVQADGTGADAWRGVVRALVFPFSFLFLGLGFLGHPGAGPAPGPARPHRRHRRHLRLGRAGGPAAVPGPRGRDRAGARGSAHRPNGLTAQGALRQGGCQGMIT